jgi:hypothetical protein
VADFFKFDKHIDTRMTTPKNIILSILVGFVTLIAGCNSAKTNDDTTNLPPVTTRNDTALSTQKVSMVISNIPFPTNILDTFHYVHATYQSNFANPANNVSLYSSGNAQAINLGIYGADLCYVISFEQFQQVGVYMKATKSLADKTGVPMAFTENIIERCQKNSNNKDSLTRIVYGSYGIIDKSLRDDKRMATEVLVLTGGWIEGLYLSTESMQTLTSEIDRQGGYTIIMEQKKYLDILLNQLDIISDSPYCQSISTSLHEIRAIFNNVKSSAINEDVIKSLKEKIESLRASITKGGNV